MKNQFAVVDDRGDGFQRVLFEGEDTGDIYTWLKLHAAMDAPGYKVIDRLTLTSWEEDVFIREFEEQMAKANAVTGEHSCLSEDRIRTIVREEMSKLLDAVREKASVPEYYVTEKMEDAVIAIVDHRAELEATKAVSTHEDQSCEGDY